MATNKKTTKKLAKKPTQASTPSRKKIMAKSSKSSSSQKTSSNKDSKELVLSARKRKATPSIFKIKSRKATPIVFTLDDVQDIINARASKQKTPSHIPLASDPTKARPSQNAHPKKQTQAPLPAPKKRFLGAASLSDILGFNPGDKKKPLSTLIDEDQIPKKHFKYYKSLLELRDQVREGLDFHAQDTLKRSSKEDTGDVSSYSQHMADAGTDTFDRDFALNLLSNEQDALYEIEEAIQRIANGSYGVCEITGHPIDPARLEAVPFTRYSLEGQKQLEKTRTSKAERGGVFSESGFEESAQFTDEDAD